MHWDETNYNKWAFVQKKNEWKTFKWKSVLLVKIYWKYMKPFIVISRKECSDFVATIPRLTNAPARDK